MSDPRNNPVSPVETVKKEAVESKKKVVQQPVPEKPPEPKPEPKADSMPTIPKPEDVPPLTQDDLMTEKQKMFSRVFQLENEDGSFEWRHVKFRVLEHSEWIDVNRIDKDAGVEALAEYHRNLIAYASIVPKYESAKEIEEQDPPAPFIRAYGKLIDSQFVKLRFL
ncbi:MAG: hypothetical protein ACXAC2_00080 [Candidatus Kariarchaeaceae archaeon]